MSIGLTTLLSSIGIFIIIRIMEEMNIIIKKLIVKKFNNKLARVKFTVKRLDNKYIKDATALITDVNDDDFTIHINDDDIILIMTYDRLISISKLKHIKLCKTSTNHQ